MTPLAHVDAHSSRTKNTTWESLRKVGVPETLFAYIRMYAFQVVVKLADGTYKTIR